MSSPDRDSPAPASLLLVAAEASSDAHGAELVRAVRARRPGLACLGFGGESMRRAGCEIIEDLTGAGSMVFGFLRHLRRYFNVLRRFDETLAERRPSAVVLIDSPGLNFLLARLARWRGVPVVYYVCPQIWAWAPWRLGKILRWTDLLLPILPFEVDLYGGKGVPVRYSGHPLADELGRWSRADGERLREERGVKPGEKLLGLFPGSRVQEIAGLTRIFCRVIAAGSPAPGSCRVMVSCCEDEFFPLIEEALRDVDLRVDIVMGDAHPLMMACDFAVVASGTASLELAYFEKPMLVLYRTSRLGLLLFRLLSVTPFIALPNILGLAGGDAGPTVVEELFAGDPAPELAGQVRELIEDGPARRRAVERLRRLQGSVFRPGGTDQAAGELLEFLQERSAEPPAGDARGPSRIASGGSGPAGAE